MYLYYNGYWFDKNEAEVVLSRRRSYNQVGLIQGETHVWTVSGKKHAADQASLTVALNLMESYLQDGGDIGLYLDDQATLTSHYLNSSATLSGTRIVDLTYPDWRGNEYGTYRSWSFVLEGTVSIVNAQLLEFSEAISFQGTGGPRRVFLETAEGLPQEQITSQRTTYRAIQTGSAKQYGTHPAAPPPIWPAAEHENQREITPLTNSGGSREFTTTWKYVFESAFALRGNPHVR